MIYNHLFIFSSSSSFYVRLILNEQNVHKGKDIRDSLRFVLYHIYLNLFL